MSLGQSNAPQYIYKIPFIKGHWLFPRLWDLIRIYSLKEPFVSLGPETGTAITWGKTVVSLPRVQFAGLVWNPVRTSVSRYHGAVRLQRISERSVLTLRGSKLAKLS